VETKKVYMLVGAEEERKLLEKMLIKRALFIGSEPIDNDDNTVDDSPVFDQFGNPVPITKKPSGSRTKVVGFGKQYAELYGLGGKFDEEAEFHAENTRFTQAVADTAAVPAAVRAHRGNKAWATGGPIAEEDSAVLAKKAQKIKRNRLAYSGISS
jgi:hypothetical protein